MNSNNDPVLDQLALLRKMVFTPEEYRAAALSVVHYCGYDPEATAEMLDVLGLREVL